MGILSEKTQNFLDFLPKGGGVSPNPKGFYHKEMRFLGIFCQKGGILSEKNENFSEFLVKRGWGGLRQKKTVILI